MMLYRMLRGVNRAYPFVVLWCYIGAFLLALPFTFIFPPLPLILVLVAAVSVAFVFLCRKLLMLPQVMLARRSLKRGMCPACGEFVVSASGEPAAHWHCVSCGTLFTNCGDEVETMGGRGEVALDHEARLA